VGTAARSLPWATPRNEGESNGAVRPGAARQVEGAPARVLEQAGAKMRQGIGVGR
jgi:hypothetical protein